MNRLKCIFLPLFFLYITLISPAVAAEPDPRFGVTHGSLSHPQGDLSPNPDGQSLLNKSTFYSANQIVSPQNTSTYSVMELNGANKTQDIKTMYGYYTSKKYLDMDARPGWITQEDIEALGFSDWSQIPDSYPVWAEWNRHHADMQKTDFAAGTMMYYGWKDIQNVCRRPGETATFFDYASGTNVQLRVLGGSQVINGKRIALQAPEPYYIDGCDSQVYKLDQFKDFIRQHRGQGMSYIIYNEMGISLANKAKVGYDLVPPELYAWHYRYYYNLIKGHQGCTLTNGESVPSLTQQNSWVDPSAKIYIGTPPQQRDDSGALFGTSGMQYIHDFADYYLGRATTCPDDRQGPWVTISNKVPTNGVALWYYANMPLTNIQGADVCTRFSLWRNDVSYYSNLTFNEYKNKLISSDTLLREFGINQVNDPNRPAGQQDLAVGVNYYTMPYFQKYDTDNANLLTLMVYWLKNHGFPQYHIVSAAYLNMHDITDWRDTRNGYVPLGIRSCNMPGNTCTEREHDIDGSQVFIKNDGSFSNKVLESYYKSIRGDYSLATNTCGLLPQPSPNCSGVEINTVDNTCTENGHTTTLNWNAVTGASKYFIVVDDDDQFWSDSPETGDPVMVHESTTTTWSTTFTSKKTRYFMIRIATSSVCTPQNWAYGTKKTVNSPVCIEEDVNYDGLINILDYQRVVTQFASYSIRLFNMIVRALD